MYARLSKYRETQHAAATQEEILLALLDGVLRFINQAKEATVHTRYADKGRAADRASAILTELAAALDGERAPEVCGNLVQLYRFASERIMRGSAELDVVRYDEATRVVQQVRDGFASALVR